LFIINEISISGLKVNSEKFIVTFLGVERGPQGYHQVDGQALSGLQANFFGSKSIVI
jgi:hypothetical protein